MVRRIACLIGLVGALAAPALFAAGADDQKMAAPAAVTAAPPADGAKQDGAKEAVAVPDTGNIMFFQNLRRIGSTIYYLGEAMGLHGWLVVKDGQVQIVYTTPDQRAVLVGALLSAEGANISQQQIMLLATARPEIAKLLQIGDTSSVRVSDAKTQKQAVAPAVVAEGQSPSEAFFDEVKAATMLTFGKADAPHLYMMMDVNCKFCHLTWKKLEPLVDGGKLRLSMIPTGALGPQSEADAVNWLNAKDPLDVWRKHVAGDAKIMKIGDLDPEKSAAVNANTKLIYKWKIDQTPYLVYRGMNGKVRLVKGMPQDIDALVLDIARDTAK